MNLFVADRVRKCKVSQTDYHWCNSGEILMFGQFQSEENRKEDEVSMCGIESRKFTTHILVKDLNISREFLLELLIESVERAMSCVIKNDGTYTVSLGEGWDRKFNIRDMLAELVDKASKFKDGDRVACSGRTLTKL